MASYQKLTKAEYAAGASDDDDITADDAPLLGLSESGHPTPAPPAPYRAQRQASWITNQPTTHYVSMGEHGATQADVSSYLPLSIFTLICCCWPLGLYATIKAVESRTLARVGLYSEAKLKGKTAKSFSIIGIIIGAIIIGTIVAVYAYIIHMSMSLFYATFGEMNELAYSDGNYRPFNESHDQFPPGKIGGD